MSQLRALPLENMILMLSYLRATDMAACLETNQAIFQRLIIARSIEKQLLESYGYTDFSLDVCHPLMLYTLEVKFILIAINAPPSSLRESSYWISTSWISNAKLYYEALSLPECGIPNKKMTPKKVSKIRARRGSEALPPWPIINCDITCCHNGLASSKGVRAKRRVIDKKHWSTLRKFFPDGPSFRSNVQECLECCTPVKEVKTPMEIKSSRYISPSSPLFGVFKRKNGVPSQSLTLKDEFEAPLAQFRPLMAGLYHVIPKEWLVRWRQYIKDASISSPPIFDCGGLLCEEHGLLLVPPHVEEFLVGKAIFTPLLNFILDNRTKEVALEQPH